MDGNDELIATGLMTSATNLHMQTLIVRLLAEQVAMIDAAVARSRMQPQNLAAEAETERKHLESMTDEQQMQYLLGKSQRLLPTIRLLLPRPDEMIAAGEEPTPIIVDLPLDSVMSDIQLHAKVLLLAAVDVYRHRLSEAKIQHVALVRQLYINDDEEDCLRSYEDQQVETPAGGLRPAGVPRDPALAGQPG